MSNIENIVKSKNSLKHLTVEYVSDILLKHGLVSKEQYDFVLKNAPSHFKTLHRHQESTFLKKTALLQLMVTPAEVISSFELEKPDTNGKILTEDEITEEIAKEVGVPYKKLDPLKLKLEIVTSHVPRAYAIRYMFVPIDEKRGIVTLAVADPFHTEGIENFATVKKLKIEIVLCSKSDILKIVREFFGFQTSILAAQAEMRPSVELGNLEQYVRLKGQKEIEATDQHVINAVEYILQYAFDQRASDIHIEPKREQSVVRFRIDGVMHIIYTTPKTVHAPIISRIKMLSRMDIAEKRKPQDGRIKTQHKDKEIELRVSTLPVAFGEKVVIRIFDPEILMQELDHLGFEQREYKLYSSFISRPNGIILVTGPTGSGKTTTLYSTLKVLATPEVNIITIEDPIEMVVEELNQVGVNIAKGITFASILRTILRQDPDIIMVGEIRDNETVENAVQSALTGHLVLSTLHTNDAPSSVIRLLDLGVPSFLISSTVIGIIAQRLVRKICVHCKTQTQLIDDEIKYLNLNPDNTYPAYYGEGCTECRGTGYRGRIGIFEIMDFTPKLINALTENPSLMELTRIAKEDGLVTLREAAIVKMLQGITTYEEVIAVT
ncbi:Type II secretory pathway, ATPase PulE/Tfp pilus assembly pathway, ATPase PilB [Candidatus Magnetoovum chiemensis]|nr:Type II secretory pathway, ATPase PulE/Tfp pilus assembly pathway, ATPase PilB [Candidatus Magnetoovum chiemensis]